MKNEETFFDACIRPLPSDALKALATTTVTAIGFVLVSAAVYEVKTRIENKKSKSNKETKKN